MTERSTGWTALVTGADRGIGAAVARRLAAEGALVAVHYSTEPERAEAVVEQITRSGGQAFALGVRFGDPGDLDTLEEALLRGLTARTGRARLDVLVNNAAMAMPPGVPFEALEQSLFEELMDVNTRAPMFLLQRLLPAISDGGRVINISTGLTRFANPDEMVHAMSKAALEMLTLHLAKPLAKRGITINTVAPGVTDNGIAAYRDPGLRAALGRIAAFERIAEPEDIADIVAFVASPDSRWVTGTWIDATGGSLLGGL
jgi:3-oxoacyl-[acyl-carrier protein] reductase